MPKILLIIIWIQYWFWLLFKSTTVQTFWIIDLIMHLLFIIQSICLLFVIYMYVHWMTKENVTEKTRSLINSVVNAIILLAIIIISLNILNLFLVDLVSNIF